jgi:hypothetical protein
LTVPGGGAAVITGHVKTSISVAVIILTAVPMLVVPHLLHLPFQGMASVDELTCNLPNTNECSSMAFS